MIVYRDKINNPYLIAYLDMHNIQDGEKIKTYDYMFWIDGKHTEYRQLHNMPEHIILNESQVLDFVKFLYREEKTA